MAQKGFNPSTAIPAEKVIACCSAIPTSKVLLGNLRPNLSNPVPPGIAAVMAQTVRSDSARAISELANTEVKEGVLGADLTCSPVATLNLGTPWYLSEAASAGGYPDMVRV
jgi:hypothetical protein